MLSWTTIRLSDVTGSDSTTDGETEVEIVGEMVSKGTSVGGLVELDKIVLVTTVG